MNRHWTSQVLAVLVFMGSAALAAAAPVPNAVPNAVPNGVPSGPPPAPSEPVTTRYFGTAVTDPYRNLENLSDPQVQGWMKAQADYAAQILAAIPGRDALLKRIHELDVETVQRSDFEVRGERLFYRLLVPDGEVQVLAWRDGIGGEEHVLVDPARQATAQAHYSLDWYAPSWDGKLVAYGVSRGGSEESRLYVVEVATGRVLDEHIDRTSDNVISWRPDNRSFFYLRYLPWTPAQPAAEEEYNAHAYLHVVGQHPDGDGDELEFGHGVSSRVNVPEGQATYIVTTPDSPYAIAVANHNMDNAPATLFYARLSDVHGVNTPWKPLATVQDGVREFTLRGDQFIFRSERNAPRFTILSTRLEHPDVLRARVVAAPGSGVIEEFLVNQDGVYLAERVGSVFELRLASLTGSVSHAVATPFPGTIGGLTADPRGTGIFFRVEGWVHAAAQFHYKPDGGAPRDTGLLPQPAVDLARYAEAREVLATSYDGTLVPLSIIGPKGMALDGSHPTLLTSYGSYGLSIDPYYRSNALAWIEHGGILAVAHVRGGGEFGEDWHRAGQKQNKLNTVFDTIACGHYLVDQGYTRAGLLGDTGRSAGGIPAGGAIAWAPTLFRVVLDGVGMSDALRVETEPNGPPNVPEFGSTSTEAGFHDLYAMSAYTHLFPGTPYPAVMYSTGAHDPRVAPWQMLKMAARTEADTSSGRPVLLRVDYDAGHGIGSSRSQREELTADEWAFALWQMGDAAFQPAAALH